MIFYFSGTGNSKYVAQNIAQKLDDNLISIGDCLKKNEFTFTVSDNESIGFVFPTYFWGLPTIIKDFVAKLELKNYTQQYTYLVATCGEECGNLFSEFKKLLIPKGIELNGAEKVALPDNYILLFNLLPAKEKQQKLFTEADNHLGTLINQIENKSLPKVKSSIVKQLKTSLMHPVYKYGRKTKHFYTTSGCNGCKLCEKICPASIITVEDSKPVWKEGRCIQCLACLHRCPQQAIQHKKRTEKRDRYVNPNIVL